jgi:hypothetical protein
VRRAGEERPDRDDALDAAVLGEVSMNAFEYVRHRWWGSGPEKRSRPSGRSLRCHREELASGPADIARLVGPHLHLGPLLREHEEVFGIEAGHALRGQVTDEMAQGARRRLTGRRSSRRRR